MTPDDDRALGDFPSLLRAHRRAAGLTQTELASLAGVAVRTVREAERGRTGRPQRTTAELLAGALKLQGEQRARFLARARGERSVVPSPRPPAAGMVAGSVRLPPPVPLTGRDAEIAGLVELVTDPTLGRGPVTLVGLAGIGKSALALGVAHRAAERFPGGVAGVVLDELGSVDDLLASITSGFGAADPRELADQVAGAPALLLLDGVDRAPHAARQALSLLPAELRVLAAGLAPVGVAGERPWPVLPLEVPPPGTGMSLDEASAYPAAALFLRRLARSRPQPPGDDEVPALVGLVRRLGGVPLALELAAGHGRLLRLPEILERYGHRVLDLGSAAGRSLRGSVGRSHGLLSASEQRALWRLAAFRHRWSVELAEWVLGDVPDPVSVLDRLVGLGLVVVRGAGEHRFRLLTVVRDFAAEQAERHGEWTAARRTHARAITALASRVTPALTGSGLRAAVAQLDELAPDIWAALCHAANDEPVTALRLASSLPRWWRLRGRDVAGRQWLRRLLDDPRTADADAAVRAWALVGLAQLANEHGDGDQERPAVESALAAFRRLGDVDGELAACDVLSAVCLAQGRPQEARQFTEAALAVATRTARLRDAAAAQASLTRHDVRIGDLAAARRRLAAADRMAAQSGQEQLRLVAWGWTAEVARLQGRCEEAVATGRRALTRLAELGDVGHRARVLGTVGQALAMLGRVEEAEQVLASLRALAGAGATASTAIVAAVEAGLAIARGDREAAAEWFAAAAEGFLRGPDRRGAVESLVGAAVCTTDPDRRRRVLAELDRVTREGGFALLPGERDQLAAVT